MGERKLSQKHIGLSEEEFNKSVKIGIARMKAEYRQNAMLAISLNQTQRSALNEAVLSCVLSPTGAVHPALMRSAAEKGVPMHIIFQATEQALEERKEKERQMTTNRNGGQQKGIMSHTEVILRSSLEYPRQENSQGSYAEKTSLSPPPNNADCSLVRAQIKSPQPVTASRTLAVKPELEKDARTSDNSLCRDEGNDEEAVILPSKSTATTTGTLPKLQKIGAAPFCVPREGRQLNSLPPSVSPSPQITTLAPPSKTTNEGLLPLLGSARHVPIFSLKARPVAVLPPRDDRYSIAIPSNLLSSIENFLSPAGGKSNTLAHSKNADCGQSEIKSIMADLLDRVECRCEAEGALSRIVREIESTHRKDIKQYKTNITHINSVATLPLIETGGDDSGLAASGKVFVNESQNPFSSAEKGDPSKLVEDKNEDKPITAVAPAKIDIGKAMTPLAQSNGLHAGMDGKVRLDMPPQLRALKLLRSGKSYHNLAVESKLDILEYLLDEIVSTDATVSAEVAKRDACAHLLVLTGQGERPRCAAYGPLPSDLELDDIVNTDECAICGLEGDLICCDGCIGSYHKCCIGMANNTKLPEGKWFCHECAINDPSKTGPLMQGRKSALDWFTLSSLGMKMQKGFVEEKVVSSLARVEFLIVHGFVFARDCEVKAAVDIDEILAGKTPLVTRVGMVPGVDIRMIGSIGAGSKPRSLTPLNQDQLFKLLLFLGPNICEEWPWCQIPLSPMKVWDKKELSKFITAFNWSSGTGPIELNGLTTTFTKRYQSYMMYFANPSSHNPMIYTNRYQHVPFINVTKNHTSSFYRFEEHTFYYGTSMPIFNTLTRDFAPDSCLAAVLRKYPTLLDPLKLLKEYTMRFERDLTSSSLLTPSWGVSGNGKLTDWDEKLTRCVSISRLAQLLVDLVDATNSRAFFEEWNALPAGKHSRSSEGSTGTSNSDERQYISLKSDWAQTGEVKRRKWERAPMSELRRILQAEPGGLESVFGSNPTFARRKKRKAKPATTQNGVERNHNANLEIIRLPDEMEVESSERNVDVTDSNMDNLKRDNAASITTSNHIPHPKRNINAFTHFLSAWSTEAKKIGTKVDGYKSAHCSKLWKALPSDEKSKWQRIADQDRERYLKEVAERDALVAKVTSQGSTEDGESNAAKLNMSSSKRQRRSTRAPKPVYGSSFQGISKEGINRRHQAIEADHATMIRQARDSKLAELKQWVRQPTHSDPVWPLAGRKLFDPEASLSKKMARWLGRNAGVKRIAHITYMDQFEVGRPSVSMLWREKTLKCRSIESLALQIEFLDSFLNRSVMHSCISLSRRASSTNTNLAKFVSCRHRDPATGKMEYFVVNIKKKRGCWMAEEDIDLSSLVFELRACITSSQKKVIGPLRVGKKEKEIKKKRASVRAEKYPRKVEAVQSRKEVAISKQIVSQQNKELDRQISSRNEMSSRPSVPKRTSDKHAPRALIAECKAKLQLCSERHKDAVVSMLAEAAINGLQAVPADKLNPIRFRAMDEMMKLNDEMHKLGVPRSSYAVLRVSETLSLAEQRASAHYKMIKGRHSAG